MYAGVGEALCDLSPSVSRGRFNRKLFVYGAGAVGAVVGVPPLIDVSLSLYDVT